MDGAHWLRDQLTSFGCAACGRSYAPEGIRVVGQRDGLICVDLACLMCGSQATALVTVTVVEDTPTRAGDGEPASGPIDTDDVLDMHRLLADHVGDLRSLLARIDARGGPVAR